jgi:hypothetical protein
MKTITRTFKFLVIVTWLAGWALAAASLHVVRTPGKFAILPKDRLNFADTYVDTRQWTTATAFEHPKLAQRVFAADKADLFEHLGTPAEIARLRSDIEGATITPTGEVPTLPAKHDDKSTRADVR